MCRLPRLLFLSDFDGVFCTLRLQLLYPAQSRIMSSKFSKLSVRLNENQSKVLYSKAGHRYTVVANGNVTPITKWVIICTRVQLYLTLSTLSKEMCLVTCICPWFRQKPFTQYLICEFCFIGITLNYNNTFKLALNIKWIVFVKVATCLNLMYVYNTNVSTRLKKNTNVKLLPSQEFHGTCVVGSCE